MTAQVPDTFENNHPRVNLGGLALRAIVCGDIKTNHGWGEFYQFAHKPTPADKPHSSALWRGYIAVFQLDSEGGLELVSYRYPPMIKRGKWKVERVHEKLVGDFWLVMKHGFFGPRTYVPFKDGKIIEDPAAWVIEQRPDERRSLRLDQG